MATSALPESFRRWFAARGWEPRAHQIALPALVSTLSICIVFVPMFLLAGIAKFLFIPLAEAVVFAMLASYGLSRTLTPITIGQILKGHHDGGS